MGHGREDRTQRHDALHPTARGDVQEQGGVGAPPPLGLQASKQQQPRTARGWLPEPERMPRPADGALPRGGQAYDRPDLGKLNNHQLKAAGFKSFRRT